jgi:amino acid adenylation domain-containing protein/non-ribosomal peptide synthase protein (TIGR01720 family)
VYLYYGNRKVEQMGIEANKNRKNKSHHTRPETSSRSNSNDQSYESILDLFYEHVKNTPDKIAVTFEQTTLSYQALHEQSNKIAQFIQKHYAFHNIPLTSETCIALCMETLPHFIVAVLGILKAGVAYVPINPKYPAKQIQHVLKDTHSAIILIEHVVEKKVCDVLLEVMQSRDVVFIEQTLEQLKVKSNTLKPSRTMEDLACVIYTSGSTGSPKGVMVPHRGILRLVQNQNYIHITSKDIFAQAASISFDATTFEIWGALLNGASLIGTPREALLDAALFSSFLNDKNISILLLTTELFHYFALKDVKMFRHLTYFLIGGDTLNIESVRQMFRCKDGCPEHVLNAYGPTENTVITTAYAIEPSMFENHKNVPIGKPINNTSVYVLDDALNPVYGLDNGELYIGGAGVALGYLNQPDLTTKQFIKNPFGEGVLYKTGDFVRYLSDGNLEYVGRDDFQVKLRGFRIELSEIEHVLYTYPGIEGAVVLSFHNPYTYLVAYYITQIHLDETLLHKHLEEHLPEYMIPRVMMKLDSMPLTINGKLDRNALPIPEFKNHNYVAPRDEKERLLCEIWQEVLGIDRVGIEDNFFQLGGHSILAMKASHGIEQALKCVISAHDIFKHRTIMMLSQLLHKDNPISVIEPTTGSVPLSFTQERLWFIEQYEKGSDVYHIPMIFVLHHTVEIMRMKNALQLIVSRHTILRTTFQETQDGLYEQIIHKRPLDIIEARIKDTILNDVLHQHMHQPFDLTKNYPLRVAFYISEETGQCTLAITLHHIAFDAWSKNVFQDELQAFYHGESRPELSIQYKDFARWQRSCLTSDIERSLAYWVSHLNHVETLAMPTDYPRPKEIDYRGATVSFTLPKTLQNAIQMFAKNQGTTVYTVLLTATVVLLSRYSGQTDIMVGSPAANRKHPQVMGLIGCFINTLALRLQLQSTASFTRTIHDVKEVLLGAQEHQDVPFERLVDELKLARDTSRHPLFQVLFNVLHEEVVLDHTLITEQFWDQNTSKFDLSFNFVVTEDDLLGSINYATALFRHDTVARMSVHFQHLLQELMDEDKALQDYKLLTKQDYHTIIYDWNNTDKTYPSDKTIHQLFEAQVKKTPNKVAVIFGAKQLTYRKLNEQSNQLARYLRRRTPTLQPDDFITLCLDRSVEMIIGILGVLKSGAAYVPIDPSYPVKRTRYIIEDTKSKLLLTHTHVLTTLDKAIPKNSICICLDEKPYRDEDKKNLLLAITSSNLAYVIYTSGTTGQPKGVMVEHKAFVFYQETFNTLLDTQHDIVTSFTLSYCFDASLPTLFSGLLSGGKVIVTHDLSTLSAQDYVDVLTKHVVNTIRLTPSMLHGLVVPLSDYSSPLTIVIGGERYDENIIRLLLKNKKIVIYNQYGPTECVVGSTRVKLNSSVRGQIIGKPYAAKRAYVLNSNHYPIPIGAVGELYIGGLGLARGYLNHPELTVERFIENSFDEGRLYKTGDLVRWLSDGNLEYIGRNDFQVKIRGYRIELGEIEFTLGGYAGIEQVYVTALSRDKHDAASSNYLAAYYISECAYSEDALRQYLETYLPLYMVPSIFIWMDSFPLTVNGKLDRKALPHPEFQINDDVYEAPRTKLEEILCSVWASVLHLERVGIKDDFFKIGGDSILSIQLTSKLRQHEIICSVRAIFENRSIERLVEYLSQQTHVSTTLTEQGILEGSFGLLPIQTCFFEQAYPVPTHWNQSFLVRVPELPIDTLQTYVGLLAAQHDVLHLRFEDGTRQVYDAFMSVPSVKVINIASQDTTILNRKLTELQSNFNLEQGPLWQVAYLHGYGDGSTRLYFAFHHLIIDSVSWRILIDDIKTLCQGQFLGEKGSSYRQWVTFMSDYPSKHPEELSYWQKVMATEQQYDPVLKKKAYHATCTLETKRTSQLLNKVNTAYHTQINDVLLTALAYALSDCFSNTYHTITLEGHGREELDEHMDLSRTVGWFTSLFPISLEIQPSIFDSIQHIKEVLRAVPNKGVGFGAFKLGVDLPKIKFNYLGQFDTSSVNWQLVNESSGRSINLKNEIPHVLAMHGMVLEGELSFSLSTHISQKIADQLAKKFTHHLVLIIEHCMKQTPHYTPSDFDTVKISRGLLDKLQLIDPTIKSIYPANCLQQGFIYHAISQPDDDAYRVQLLLDYHVALDIDAYQQAWNLAIETYPMLRTYFNWDEEVIQITSKQGCLDWTFHDIQEAPDKEKAITAIQQADRLNVFDLEKNPLFRLHMIRQATSTHTLLITWHHSITDGWSNPVLLGYIHRMYQALTQGKTPNLQLDTAYSRSQVYIATHQSSAHVYWEKTLHDVNTINDLNMLLSQPVNLDEARRVVRPQTAHITLEGASYQAMQTLTRTEGMTLHTLTQFAWHKLIQIYTRDDQTIVGTTVSGRTIPIPGIESSIGLYINTLPLVIDWGEGTTTREQLQQFEARVVDLNEYCYAHLASLQHEGHRLFHSLFVFENYPEDINKDADELDFSFRTAIEKTDYLLGLVAYVEHDSLHLKLNYDDAYLTREKAVALLAQVKHIIEQISSKLDEQHETITSLLTQDYQTIVYDWNQTHTVYPCDKTIHQIFEEQVRKTPHHFAVVCDEETLTYQELDKRSNQLAREIITYNPNGFVTLCLDRSIEMIVAMLGVLKAGLAYVPIAPNCPQERIKHILTDTESTLLLTQSCLVLDDTLLEHITRLNLDNTTYLKQSDKPCSNHTKPSDLAYLIYTSGTTGLPKGVMIEHQHIVDYVLNMIKTVGLSDDDQHLMLHDYVFDLGLTSLYGALLSGAALHLLIQNHREDADYIVEYVLKHNINFIKSTPLYIDTVFFNDSRFSAYCNNHSFKFVLGGEKLNHRLIKKIQAIAVHGYLELFNHYGPTETTVGSHILCVNQENAWTWFEKNSVIGNGFISTKTYILDRTLNPIPIGAIGELYIGGAGLARGYLNQPQLTQERFISNPFATKQDKAAGYTRLYKTGDLVRYLPDGNIEYIGRDDFQVKLRGFRIELGEIEYILYAYPGIEGAVVLSVQEPQTYLVAYYTSQIQLDEVRIRQHLEEHLPEYMIPRAIMKLDNIPLTVNKKLDRNALPLPDFKTHNYVAPRDKKERLLCKIWQDILNVERVGIEDDFFQLGGHSILAMKASHGMGQALKCIISVHDIFKYRTIATLSQVLHKNNALTVIAPITGSVPLSFTQERLWFIEQYEEGSDVYHIPMIFVLHHTVDMMRMKDALQLIVSRHAILRTTFQETQDGLYEQIVHEWPLDIIEARMKHSMLNDVLHQHMHQSFDLTKNYPLRVAFYISEETGQCTLAIILHHIAFDAWSRNVFQDELQAFYHGELRPELSIQYKDFAGWQRRYLTSSMEESLAYWVSHLNHVETLTMPTDYPRPKEIDYRGATVSFNLSKTLQDAIRLFAKNQGATVYTVLLTATAILLSRYSGQTDIIIGSPVANRQHPQVMGLIGCFINTLALRLQLQSTASFTRTIHDVQAVLLGAQEHQDVPFERLVDELKLERDNSRHPLFQILFNVVHEKIAVDPNLMTPQLWDQKISKFDLSFNFVIKSDALSGSINFATALFKHDTVTRMSVHFKNLLHELMEEDKELQQYKLMTVQDYQMIVYDWNQTYIVYRRDKTINQLFEEQVKKTPNQVAVTCDEQTVTYQELDKYSNQLARKLLNHNPSHLVVLCFERSIDMIIAMFGVLKAGLAYVPIDPSCPRERLKHILTDTQSTLLLTQSFLELDDTLLNNITRLNLDGGEVYRRESDKSCSVHVKLSDLAYVIYTSGTTGLPKGVAIEHTNIINYYQSVACYFESIHQVDFSSNFAFDLSVTTALVPFLLGKTVCIYSGALQNITDYIAHLSQHRIEFIKSTPTYLSQLAEFETTPLIKTCFIGGEKPQKNQLEKIACFTNNIYDEYGPTEATVGVMLMPTSLNCTGKRYANTKVYILNSMLNPVPIGAIGELYLGGAGLARGYLNQPKLTAERFILNPFATKQDQIAGYTRLYKTGDLARYLPDGKIEYIGREDFQIKLRGYRIELGEIEHALHSYPAIKHAVVLITQEAHPCLVAYYTTKEQLEEDLIQKHLQAYLPEYMLPHAIMKLDCMPLTPNGKLDRHALPAPKFEGKIYVAPRSEKERLLCKIWEEVLGVERVGIEDDFFQLGGDSIQSIMVCAHLRHQSINCRIKDIFTYRCIKNLNHVLCASTLIDAEQGILTGAFPLLPIQTWFFQQDFPKPNHWNQSFMMRVPSLNMTRLNAILPGLIEQHDILRVRFVEGYQAYLSEIKIPLIQEWNIKDVTVQIMTQWQGNFDLEEGPLWRIEYISGYSDGSARLYFALHHLITDTVSWRILGEDIKHLYQHKRLGEKSSSYRQWVNNFLDLPDVCKNQLTKTPLPKLSSQQYTGHVQLSKKNTGQLLTEANKAYHTEINDLLLTALGLVLQDWLGGLEYSITLEGHGREEVHEHIDVSHTVGWFTSMYPVRLKPQKSLSRSIQWTKENLRTIPNKGLGFRALETLSSIIFNYLGQFNKLDDDWEIVAEESGVCIHPDNERAHVLHVSGRVTKGCLYFFISTYTSDSACKKILSLFKQHLLSLIDHCIQQSPLYTCSDFPTVKISQKLLNQLQKDDPEIEAIYPMTAFQHELTRHALAYPDDEAYRGHFLWDYNTALDVALYEKAWLLAIDQHPILRTYFNWDENPIQIITRKKQLQFTLHTDKLEMLESIQKQDRAVAFNLQQPTLLRINLIKHNDQHYTLIKCEHHSIGDGWSRSILQKQVDDYYLALTKEKYAVQTIDSTYMRAQAYMFQHKETVNQYWQQQLEPIKRSNDLNQLLTCHVCLNDVRQLKRKGVQELSIVGENYMALKKEARQNGLTMNIFFQFVWHKVIQFYTHDTQTIVGTVCSGRNIPISGIEQSVGLYINILPLIIDWQTKNSISEQLEILNESISALNEHSFVNLAELEQYTDRLFNSVLVFQNYPEAELEQNPLNIMYKGAEEKLHYPLVMTARERNEELLIRFVYDAGLIAEHSVINLLKIVGHILKSLPHMLDKTHQALDSYF